MLKKLKNTKLIIVEEVMKIGSLASLIMQYNYEYNLNLEIVSYGIDDIFLDCGKREEIKKLQINFFEK